MFFSLIFHQSYPKIYDHCQKVKPTFFLSFGHFCTPKWCRRVHCLVLEKNNHNYVFRFTEDNFHLEIQVAGCWSPLIVMAIWQCTGVHFILCCKNQIWFPYMNVTRITFRSAISSNVVKIRFDSHIWMLWELFSRNYSEIVIECAQFCISLWESNLILIFRCLQESLILI